MNLERFRFFKSMHHESDLFIGIPAGTYNPGMLRVSQSELFRLRKLILDHINKEPLFGTSLEPLLPLGASKSGSGSANIPPEILNMLQCSAVSGTGPMSSVAGIIAENVASRLIREFELDEVVVENGGDLFVKNKSELISVIHAGTSPLSDRMAFVLQPGEWGVCTSSGTMGHSFSRGSADAVSVITKSASLADAWATSLANLVKTPDDIEPVLEKVKGIKDILGFAVIIGDRIGIRGEIEVKPLS